MRGNISGCADHRARHNGNPAPGGFGNLIEPRTRSKNRFHTPRRRIVTLSVFAPNACPIPSDYIGVAVDLWCEQQPCNSHNLATYVAFAAGAAARVVAQPSLLAATTFAAQHSQQHPQHRNSPTAFKSGIQERHSQQHSQQHSLQQQHSQQDSQQRS